jgi:hypothetical protein
MKFKWEYQNRFDAKGAPLRASLTLNLIGSEDRRSYVGWVFLSAARPAVWKIGVHELNDYLGDAEHDTFTSRLSAMRELRKRFIVAWIGATQEERDAVWD